MQNYENIDTNTDIYQYQIKNEDRTWKNIFLPQNQQDKQVWINIFCQEEPNIRLSTCLFLFVWDMKTCNYILYLD